MLSWPLVYVSQCIRSLLPVYPLYGFQGDVFEKQIRLQHYFCLKFFRDCLCLQEQPRLLNLAFKATSSTSPLSSLLTPVPLTLGILRSYWAVSYWWTKELGCRSPLCLGACSFLCPGHSSPIPPSSSLPACLFQSGCLATPWKMFFPRTSHVAESNNQLIFNFDLLAAFNTANTSSLWMHFFFY